MLSVNHSPTMSKQRLVLSLILVNGHRDLLGVEDIEIPTKHVKTLERVGQKFTTQTLKKLLELCSEETAAPPRPHHD
jgi:hypothetical protein